jgi:hypothetical protein
MEIEIDGTCFIMDVVLYLVMLVLMIIIGMRLGEMLTLIVLVSIFKNLSFIALKPKSRKKE